MKFKGRIKWWLLSAIALVMLIFAGAYGCYLYIPSYIENSLLPEISNDLGTTIQASVRKFSFSGADLGNVTLTNDDGELRVDSVRIDYSLWDLLDGHIDELTISGADLNVTIKEGGGFVIAGIDIEALQNRKAPQKEATPWAIDQLSIKSCNLNLSYHNYDIRIPFDAIAKSLSDTLEKCTVAGHIYPFGKELAFSTSLDSDTNKLECDVVIPNFNTMFLEDFRSQLQIPKLAAALKVKSNFEFNLQPFSLEHGSLEIQSDDFKYCDPLIGISLAAGNGKTTSIKVDGDDSSLRFALQGLHISKPTEAVLTTKATVNIEGDTLKIAGDIGVTLTKNLQIKQDSIDSSEQITLHYLAEVDNATNKWQVKVGSELATNSSRKIHFQNQQISLPNLTLQIEGEGDFDRAKIKYSLISNEFNYKADQFCLGGSKLKLSGEFYYAEETSSSKCTISCDTIYGTFPNGKVEFKEFKISDAFKFGANAEETSNGVHDIDLNAASGTVSYSSSKSTLHDLKCKLAVEGLEKITGVISVGGFSSAYPPLQITTAGSFQVPFSWPLASSNQDGFIQLTEITYNSKALGKLSLKTALQENNYKLSGTLNPVIPAGSTVQLLAIVDKTLSKATLDYKIDKTKIENLKNLEELIGTSIEIDFNGWLSCHGQVIYQNGVVDASTDLTINDGNLILSDEGDKLQGIDLWLAFPSLRTLKSKPKQKVSHVF